MCYSEIHLERNALRAVDVTILQDIHAVRIQIDEDMQLMYYLRAWMGLHSE